MSTKARKLEAETGLVEVGNWRGPLREAVKRKLISREQRAALQAPTELDRERCVQAWAALLSPAELRRLREILEKDPAAYLRWSNPPARPRSGP